MKPSDCNALLQNKSRDQCKFSIFDVVKYVSRWSLLMLNSKNLFKRQRFALRRNLSKIHDVLQHANPSSKYIS